MEPKPVQVRHEGRWYDGTLSEWKRDERGWMAHVRWSEGPGLNHVSWEPAHRLRPGNAKTPASCTGEGAQEAGEDA